MGTVFHEPSVHKGDKLHFSTDENLKYLKRGEHLALPDHRAALYFQSDGNLVMYRAGPVADNILWNSGTFGMDAQNLGFHPTTGILTLWGTGGSVIWQLSGQKSRQPTSQTCLEVQTDGNLCIWSDPSKAEGTNLWSMTVNSTNLAPYNPNFPRLRLRNIIFGTDPTPGLSDAQPAQLGTTTMMNSTNLQQKMTSTLEWSRTEQVEWRFSDETKVAVGAKASFTVGLPGLAEGSAEVSADLSKTRTTTAGTMEQYTTKGSLAIDILVPAWNQMKVSLVVQQKRYEALGWEGQMRAEYEDGSFEDIAVKGEMRGSLSTETTTTFAQFDSAGNPITEGRGSYVIAVRNW